MVVSDESKGGAPKKLSTKDILAAARAQAAQAAGGDASASAPDAGAQAEPAAEVKAPAKPPAATKPTASAKPTGAKKPTSTADILAAARAQATSAQAAGGAAAPAAEAPATPKAAPAAKPAAAGGKPKSTADILAAARAAASGAAAPAASESGSEEKPAAKEKPSKATVAKAAPAATGEGPKLSVQEMLAAVRPGGAAPAAETPSAADKPSKPTVAPPMPPKPAPVKAAFGKPIAAPAPDAGRRNVLIAALLVPFALIGGLFSSAFAAAWTMLAATTGIATLATARFMLPNVLTEPPSKFKIGSPSDFDLGTVATRFVASNGVWIVHTEGYKGKNLIYALISVCTHLGCTPSWLEGERKFKCPCHGSGFYITGINFEGPAPRPLERAGIRLAEDGMLEVDKSVKFQEEMGQWNDPTSFFEVVG